MVSGKRSELVSVKRKMRDTIASLDKWFCANDLKVNTEKIQLMLLANPKNLRNATAIMVKFRDHNLSPTSDAKRLGVIFDRTFSWKANDHLSQDAVSAYLLGGLSHLRSRLLSSAISVLVNALVLSRVRYPLMCSKIDTVSPGNGSKKSLARI